MTHALALLAVLLAAVLVLSACSRRAQQGPDTVLVGTSTALCQGIAQFRLATVGLTGGVSALSPAGLRRIVGEAVLRLKALAAEPSAPDTMKQDFATVAGGFDQIDKTLDASGAADCQAVVAALVTLREDKKVSEASARLDTVAHRTCGFNTEGPVSSTTPLSPVTTVSPVGSTTTA